MGQINESHCRQNHGNGEVIIADFFTDIASEYVRQLRNSGYEIPSSLDDNESIVRLYLNVYHRKISMRPRKVHKAEYETPSDLIEGERLFLAKVEAGHDLRPYQSTKLKKLAYEDGMLNDFGIHHFHLGIEKYQKDPFFMARQKTLLFARVDRDDFYCISYYKHRDWSQNILLDIIHLNWPDTISSYAIKGVTSVTPQYNNEEYQELRKNGLSALTQRPDGTVHVSPGGGISSANTSVLDTRRLWDIERQCSQLKEELSNQVMKLISLGKVTPPVYLSLRFVYGFPFAYGFPCVEISDGKSLIYPRYINIINLQL